MRGGPAFPVARVWCFLGSLVCAPPGGWPLSTPLCISVSLPLPLSRSLSLFPPGADRAPWMQNRQRQALVSAYSATNVTIAGSGTISGNGWPWWNNVTSQVRPQPRHPSTIAPAFYLFIQPYATSHTAVVMLFNFHLYQLGHSHRMLIGACNPILKLIHDFRAAAGSTRPPGDPTTSPSLHAWCNGPSWSSLWTAKTSRWPGTPPGAR